MARDGGHEVVLWTRDAARAAEIASRRENVAYLPGVSLPSGVLVTADLERAAAAPALVVAAPTVGVGPLRDRLASLVRADHRLCSATKGLMPGDARRMSEIWGEVLAPARVAVLSGPNISREIASGLPAPTVIASSDRETANIFQALIGTPMFRAYTNDDVIGVELCGALKNIIALGAGAIDGIGYGVNAKAGFLTRGLAEIARFAFSYGADPLTCAGLAGFGDLIATCMSAHSRNRTVGEQLAQGQALVDIERRLGGQIAEGVGTTAAVHGMAALRGVEMPITTATYRVLFEGHPVREAMRELMERERGEELSGPLAEASRRLRRSGPVSGAGDRPAG